MPHAKFSDESLLMSGAPEQRVVIAFSMLDVEVVRQELEDLFSSYLNWPWIIMQAMHHRTISMQWAALKRLDMVRGASKSGMPKNWIAYSEQLSRASLKRNLLWLERLEWIFDAFEKAGIEAVCIKGGALIGDIYDPETRMLGDIDTLVRNKDRKAVRELLFELGFEHGIIDPGRSTIVPLSREKRLFWSLNAHIMPKFTLKLGDPDCPFLRFAVGFNFFDPGDSHSYPSEPIISRRVRKSATSRVYVPDVVDTIVNLCIHIFREATSATFGFVGENWNLWKFCDFRSQLTQVDAAKVGPILKQRLQEACLEKPFYYALHYTNRIYGDQSLKPWLALCDPGEDLDYLHEVADGDRIIRNDKPFAEKLFHAGRVEIAGLKPAWSNVMHDGEWW
jgi:Uncharacterised nucleotidyltransferase